MAESRRAKENRRVSGNVPRRIIVRNREGWFQVGGRWQERNGKNREGWYPGEGEGEEGRRRSRAGSFQVEENQDGGSMAGVFRRSKRRRKDERWQNEEGWSQVREKPK